MLMSGGAAIAAQRLNQGLRREGIDSRFLSARLTGNEGVDESKLVCFGGSLRERIWRRWRRHNLNRLARRHQAYSSRHSTGFGFDLSTDGMALENACQDADVLNFHWVNGLLDYPHVLPRLKPQVPLVWTLHDMSPLTGGCHYALDCRAFHAKCGQCPQLGSSDPADLSVEIWRRKASAMSRMEAHLSLVTPSEWLAGEARKSSLLRPYPVQCIPNGLDVRLFFPRHQQEERRQLGLRPDAPVVLFVAAALDNPVKGLQHLFPAMPGIQSRHASVQFLAVGDQRGKDRQWPVPVHTVSTTDPEKMACIYSCADLLVVPSLADNFPNVILEAMACGVPAMGFQIGGIPEAIGRDGQTGRLVPEISSNALEEAISSLLTEVMTDREAWRQRCRTRAEREFALEIQARRYASLYQTLLEKTHRWAEPR